MSLSPHTVGVAQSTGEDTTVYHVFPTHSGGEPNDEWGQLLPPFSPLPFICPRSPLG
jgi:hypothetical protein